MARIRLNGIIIPLCDLMYINIGEPSLPLQLASRGKPRIVPSGYQLVDGDRDFHVVNLTPSATLLTEVKANPDGTGNLPSLYRGDLDRLEYSGIYCKYLVCNKSCIMYPCA